MENEIYRRLYKNSNESEYGEPSYIIATKESNGYGVWDCSPENGNVIIKYCCSLYDREEALELATKEYRQKKGGK